MALFIDRSHEFEVFDRALTQARRRGQLFLIHGRPGAGKTTLIRQWLSARRKRALVWTPQAGSDELEQALNFAQALGRFLKRAPVPTGPFASEVWRAAFHHLAEAAVSQRQIIVIDQATDLMPQYSALVNGLKQAWDQELQGRAVLVILVGDHGARIFEHLRSYSRAPLYGRFTAIWRLDPISWADFSAAFRRWPLRERLLAYAVTGGWPVFVSALRPEQKPRSELRRLMHAPAYRHSVEAVAETIEPTPRKVVLKVLRALAHGPAHLQRLAQWARLSRRSLNAALVDLETAGLVETRDVPLATPLPWTQRVVFHLVDQQVRGFFGSIEPRARTPAGQGARPLPVRKSAWVDGWLADLVAERLLVPWLFRDGSRGRRAAEIDDVGPLIDRLPCDSALAARDRQATHVLVCGVFGQSRPLGARRVRAFARAATRLLASAWPGATGQVLVVSLAGFTAQARHETPARLLLDVQTLARAVHA